MYLKQFIKAVIFFFALVPAAFAQVSYIDSIKNAIRISKNDTDKLVLYSKLSVTYSAERYDSALISSQQYYQLAKGLNYKLDEAYALDNVGYNMFHVSNPKSLQFLLEGVRIAEDPEIEKLVLPEKYWNEAVYYDTNALPKNLKKTAKRPAANPGQPLPGRRSCVWKRLWRPAKTTPVLFQGGTGC
jgi:hypothetical protein